MSEPVTLPRMVATERLRLILITPEDAADMLAGRHQGERWHPDYPRPDDVDAAALVKELSPWGPRHVVLGVQAVGSIGFFGPPVGEASAEVQVGYGLVEAARGRGVATEALLGLLAETDRLGVGVRASVAPANRSGLRVLAKAGFTELRGSDEDGGLVMARPVRS